MMFDDQPLDAAEVAALLDDLCVKLGFCLAPEQGERLQRDPPANVDSFTNAVFAAEGLQPETADRHLYRQVRAMVAAAFERAANTDHAS